MDLNPKTLTGRFIRLEPIAEHHREGLREAANTDPSIFKFIPSDVAGEFDAWFDWSLKSIIDEGHIVYIVQRLADDRLVGSSRYLNISTAEPCVEIGFTWYIPEAQGTAVNPEAKLLLMQNAFETWGCARVELKTDARNARSRRAMEKMGATYEGTFRKHMRVARDYVRDSAYFAVIDDDWPAVKSGLEARLAKFDKAAE